MRGFYLVLGTALLFNACAHTKKHRAEKFDIAGTWTSEKCESLPNGQGGEMYFTRTFPMTEKE